MKRCIACAVHSQRILKGLIKPLCDIDWNITLEEHASELDRQALDGTCAVTFKIVRMLSRGGVRGNTDVKLDSGVLSAPVDDRDLAWLQHYSRVFQAE
eukprot:7941770-Pyramimonas_sp.AAC.1